MTWVGPAPLCGPLGDLVRLRGFRLSLRRFRGPTHLVDETDCRRQLRRGGDQSGNFHAPEPSGLRFDSQFAVLIDTPLSADTPTLKKHLRRVFAL